MIEINVRHIGQFFCILLIFFLGILLIFKPEDTYFFSGWFAVVFLSILLNVILPKSKPANEETSKDE